MESTSAEVVEIILINQKRITSGGDSFCYAYIGETFIKSSTQKVLCRFENDSAQNVFWGHSAKIVQRGSFMVWDISMGVCPRLEFDNIMFTNLLGYNCYIYGAFEFLCNSIANL